MLTITNLQVAFTGKPVLRGVDVQVNAGEILCLLGPSGCGKTTLLRVIAGLEQAGQGDLLLDGQSIQSIPVNQRGFGLMFQDFALFPHLTVAQNVAFGLEMQGRAAAERHQRVREVLQLVDLNGFADRDIARLSGGERQRVALARSLAPRPRLLMLDEPLGSLDAALREQLVIDLRAIIKRVGLTAIHVTHDQREAYAMADRIALMNQGRIEQLDTPARIYQHPLTVFAARFLGLHNLVPVTRWRDGVAETGLGHIPVSTKADWLLLHPDHLTLGPSRSTAEAFTVKGQVSEVIFLGEAYRLKVHHATGIELQLRIPAAAIPPALGHLVTIAVGQVLPVGS
jgi:ABC-type Fe3+/spermidine/putrescine transport system ATPase subunit